MDATLAEWQRIDDILITTQLASLLSLAVLNVLAVRIGLNPSQRLRTRLEEVHRGDVLDMGAGFGPDLSPVAGTVEMVLQRNQQVVERSRHQAADLSRALKKPLAILGIEARKADVPGP